MLARARAQAAERAAEPPAAGGAGAEALPGQDAESLAAPPPPLSAPLGTRRGKVAFCAAAGCTGAAFCSCAPTAGSTGGTAASLDLGDAAQASSSGETSEEGAGTVVLAQADTLTKADQEEATCMLLRALESGDFGTARRFQSQADLRHVNEAGWSCVHWAVHAAGTALEKPSTEISDAQSDCPAGCCGAVSKGYEARMFLKDLLSLNEHQHVVNVRSSDGATPLMFAADAGDAEACEWLLAAGADVAALDNDGDSAATWAQNKHHRALASRLASLEAASRA